MHLLIAVGFFGALYLFSRRNGSGSAGPFNTDLDHKQEQLIPRGAPTAVTRESFFAGDNSGREWWPDLTTAIDGYMRDLFSGGDLAPFAATPMPPNSVIEAIGSAEAPLEAGTRVTFVLRNNGTLTTHVLEGAYLGTTDPSAGPATVSVDRIAGGSTENVPAFGNYSIPASKYKNYHTLLSRAVWYAIDPVSAGLSIFEETPVFAVGDRVTACLRDLQGTIVVGIVTVKKRAGNELEVLLTKVHKVIDDEGSGPVVFSRVNEQATIPMRVDQMVNPKGL